MFSMSMEEIHSPPRLDDILGPVRDADIAVLVDRRDVAGVEESFLVQDFAAFALEIRAGDRHATHLQPPGGLAVPGQPFAGIVGELELDGEGRMADRLLHVELFLALQIGIHAPQCAHAAKRAGFGHAPGVDDLDAVFVLELLRHGARAG